MSGPAWVVAIASALFLACLVARWQWVPRATWRALEHQDPTRREWRLACMLARLLGPSVAIVVVAVLFLIAQPRANSDVGGLVVFVAGLASGVVSKQIFQELTGGAVPYWRQVVAALRAALPTFPGGQDEHGSTCADEGCQALVFNQYWGQLSDPAARPYVLRKIFSAAPHPVERPAAEAAE